MRKTLSVLTLVLIVLPILVLAVDPVIVDNPLDATTTEEIIENLIGFLFKIGIVLAPLMIIIGGFLFVTAGGNIEQVNRAKKIIIWTLVGFFVVLLARGIMDLIYMILGLKE